MRWIGFIFLIVTTRLYSAEALLVNAGQGKWPLGSYLELLEDAGGGLTLDDVRSTKYTTQWVPNRVEPPHLGTTNAEYWARLNIKNVLPENQQLLLEVGYPHLDMIDFYLLNENGVKTSKHCGSDYKFAIRDIPYRNCVFTMELDRNNHTIYLHSKSQGSMILPLILWQPNTFAAEKIRETSGLFLYYGIILVMVIYNIYLLVATGRINYFYFVMYISCLGFWMMSMNGVAFPLFWPNSVWWGKVSNLFIIAAAQCWAALFFRDFLNTKTYAPIMNKILITLAAMGAILAVFTLLIPYRICLRAADITGAVTLAAEFVAALICLKRGYKPARFFLLATMLFIIGGVIMGLRVLGLVPAFFITEYAMQIGSAVEALLFSIALTDQIKYEHGLAQAKIKKLTKRMSRLKIGKKKVSSSLEDKNILVAMITHDIANPLGVSTSAAEMLGMLLEEPSLTDKNRLAKYTGIIVKANDVIFSIISQVKLLESVDNKHDFEFQPVNVPAAFEESFFIIKDKIAEKKIVLTTTIDGVAVCADKSALVHSIINNLMTNAIKFSKIGGRITCTARLANEDQVLIEVADEGCGIPAEMHSVIFSIGQKTSRRGTSGEKGTGFGLPIAKKLITKMGGTITLASPYQLNNGELCSGTKFSVVLPRQQENFDKPASNAPKDLPSGSTKTAA